MEFIVEHESAYKKACSDLATAKARFAALKRLVAALIELEDARRSPDLAQPERSMIAQIASLDVADARARLGCQKLRARGDIERIKAQRDNARSLLDQTYDEGARRETVVEKEPQESEPLTTGHPLI